MIMAYSRGKSRFWLSYTGGRGSVQRHGIPAGDGVHPRGWNAGARVTPRVRDDRDEFDVYMTTGSHDSGHSVHLGTVRDTPDGPAWEPAGQVLTLAQLRNGTGFPRGARFVMLPPER
jgi:hypothetical protein